MTVITFQKVKLIHIGQIHLYQQYLKIQFSGEMAKLARLWNKRDTVFSRILERLIMERLAWNGVCLGMLLKAIPRFREV